MGRLDGKVSIVTGAAPRGEGTGNGSAMAILKAREGAKVLLLNRSADRADSLASKIAVARPFPIPSPSAPPPQMTATLPSRPRLLGMSINYFSSKLISS